MPSFVFNIAKGAVAEKARDDSIKFGVLLLKAAEVDATLEDYDDIAALLLAAGNTEADFTNYARKTAVTGTLTVNDTANVVRVDLPDSVFTNAGGAVNNTLVKLIVFYDEGGTDATRIPLTHHDFAITTNGNTITARYNVDGFFEAANAV